MGSTGKRSFISKETSSLRQEVRELAVKVDGIDLMLTKRANIDNLSAKLDRINIAIFGDGYTAGGGMSQKVTEMIRKGDKLDVLYDLIVGKGRSGEKYAYKNQIKDDYDGMAYQVDFIQAAVILIMAKLELDYTAIYSVLKK